MLNTYSFGKSSAAYLLAVVFILFVSYDIFSRIESHEFNESDELALSQTPNEFIVLHNIKGEGISNFPTAKTIASGLYICQSFLFPLEELAIEFIESASPRIWNVFYVFVSINAP